MLVFVEGGKPENPEKTNKNSTHIDTRSELYPSPAHTLFINKGIFADVIVYIFAHCIGLYVQKETC